MPDDVAKRIEEGAKDAKQFGFMDSGKDPKGWDRATIKLKTHPLHPMPRVKQEDLIMPSAASLLRRILDCMAVGISLALLCYFPLLMIAYMRTDDISTWIYGTMITVATVTTVWVFALTVLDERRFRAELEA